MGKKGKGEEGERGKEGGGDKGERVRDWMTTTME
jgi:hypothetical protein